MRALNLRLAWRNLTRHRWRSFLTAGGVAVAVAVLIWSHGMMDAFTVKMVDAALGTQVGHLQIEDRRHVDRPLLPLAVPAGDALVERLRAVPEVEEVRRRLATFGLVGTEQKSQPAVVMGVDPSAERGIARGLKAGHWLAAAEQPVREGPMPAVVGEGLARQLGAKVGDELVLLTQAADGSSGDALLNVVGIARSGVVQLDRQAVWVRLADLGWLLALDGKAHEIAVGIARDADLGAAREAVRAAIRGQVEGADVAVRTWKEVLPQVDQMVEVSQSSMWLVYLIMYVLAGLGLLNAQRMSALERRREFGVLLAVGITPGRIGRLVLSETLLLTAIGGVVGAGLGLAATFYFSRHGLAMGTGESVTYLGMTLDPVVYFSFSGDMALAPLLTVLLVGIVCGLWPAASSARLDAVRAISGRT